MPSLEASINSEILFNQTAGKTICISKKIKDEDFLLATCNMYNNLCLPKNVSQGKFTCFVVSLGRFENLG